MLASTLQDSVIPSGSALLRTSFIVLAVFVAAGFVAAVAWSAHRSGRNTGRRDTALTALGAALWLAATGIAAGAGVLSFTAPPTMAIVIVLSMAIAIGSAFSPLGRRIALTLPVAALVGFQAFRVAVELLMHRAYAEGLMPVQMSYSGRNFDIVSGLSAIVVAIWLARRPSPRVLFAWNTLGALLLANILVVAVLSAPTPLRAFTNEPANVWITRAPWVWLPAVMVVGALMGHLLIYRRLWIESRPLGSKV
jgi:hypothetical protein